MQKSSLICQKLVSKVKSSIAIISFRRNFNDAPYTDPTDKIRTRFGATPVSPESKQPLVNDIFYNVAKKYDVMNDIMSFGIHRLWKDELMNMLSPTADTDLIDVGGGTGDIAFRFCRRFEPENFAGSATVCDVNSKMMEVGKKRSENVKNGEKIKWVEGKAEKLPFEADAFSAYTIAFALRNVTDIRASFTEARRVLKPGGRLLCLELSRVENDSLRPLYNLYKNEMIPMLGHFLYNSEKEYRYLAESIDNFPSQEDLAQIMTECGFKFVSYRNLTFGVVAIHSGFVV